MRVDPDDLRRHMEEGVFVQHAFVDAAGMQYLDPAERELFISGCCAACWDLLCPSSTLAYS